MAMRAGDMVETRQLERLRVEIIEAISSAMAYPPFFDFRTGALRTRPIDRTKVAEIEQFMGSANFSPIERASPSSPDTRKFIERLLLRYVEVNPSLNSPGAARYLPLIRAQARKLGADTHRRFVAYLNGTERDFGARRQAATWASPRRGGRSSTVDLAHSGRMLETVLQQPRPATRRPDGTSRGSKSAPTDLTAPAQAVAGISLPSGDIPLPIFSSSVHAPSPTPHSNLPDQPTGPLAAVAQPRRAPAGGPVNMREVPQDLLNLYGDYLGDIEPAPPGRRQPVPPAQVQPARAPAPPPPVPGVPQAPIGTPPPDARGDQLIFWQLRYQLEAYVRLAARSYGLPGHGGDPASVLDELRRSGFVDEADLRIAEGVFALTDRVTAQGQATTADYRQALMLYLLYHRSHISA